MSGHVGESVWVCPARGESDAGGDLGDGVTIERASGGVVEVPEVDVGRLGARGAIELSGGEREALRDELRGGLAMTGSWGDTRVNQMWVGDDFEELPWDHPKRVAQEWQWKVNGMRAKFWRDRGTTGNWENSSWGSFVRDWLREGRGDR